ncbi:MAG: DUF4402 domain-containing protein [Ignavibacteriae bacterium]|nr:DUF4402 domain-containing protein [Ignavibacteriota bacterium]
MKKIILTILTILIVLGFKNTSAQDNNFTTLSVRATLERGLAMEGGNSLFLGELALRNSENQKIISNFDGLKFTILGQSNRMVTILYDQSVTLTNITNNRTGKQSYDDAKMTFKTNVAEETGSENGYTNPNPLPSGTSIALYDMSKVGKLNLWIGGTMQLPLSLKNGKYIGNFVVTSVY